MVHMFPPGAVKRDPTEIELVKEVTLQQLSDWLVQAYEGLPEHLMRHLRDLEALKRGLYPIYDEMREGDSMWLCRSHLIGPLHGNEGVALVRDKQPIIYIQIIQY